MEKDYLDTEKDIFDMEKDYLDTEKNILDIEIFLFNIF